MRRQRVAWSFPRRIARRIARRTVVAHRRFELLVVERADAVDVHGEPRLARLVVYELVRLLHRRYLRVRERRANLGHLAEFGRHQR